MAPGGVAVTDLTAGFHPLLRKGITLLRMLGNISVISNAAAIAEFTMGIAYVSDEAAAAGAFPDPSTDASFPWLWWKRVLQENDNTDQFAVDVKSMRKFREANARIFFIMENDDAIETLNFGFGIRLLYSLP